MTQTGQAGQPGAPVLIAAGGTGGHLFPARALAEDLRRRGIAVELVSEERAQSFGHDFPAQAIHLIPAATPVGKSPIKLIRALMTLARGVYQARRMIGHVAPSLVVGFGGYPTVPPLIAARLRGVASLVHEQNAVMGRANRLLSRLASAVALSVPDPAKAGASVLAKSVLTGNPVRDAVIAASAVPYQTPQTDGPFKLLVFGGSQGAHVFSELLPQAVKLLDGRHRSRLVITQQARSEDLGQVRAAYDAAGVDAEIATFFADLPQRMADAHLVVCRSGASTVSEIAAIGRPSIMVPLPHAIDNDQLHNARALEAAGGGWTAEQSMLDASALARDIGALMDEPDRLAEAAGAARAAGRPQAAEALGALVEHLAKGGDVRTYRATA